MREQTFTKARLEQVAQKLESGTLHMSKEDAMEYARLVQETFAGQAEVPDDSLDADKRSVFYALEGQGILTYRREERNIESGEKRRFFYWRVNWAGIGEAHQSQSRPDPDSDVYADLPQSAWRHGV